MSDNNDALSIDAEDLSSYLSDNGLWVETYAALGLFGEAAAGYEPERKAPRIHCPLHGGRTGEAFSFIKKGKFRSDRTGVGGCNSCGGIGGYKLVMEDQGWTFPQTLEALAKASGYLDGIKSGTFKPKPKSAEQLERERQAKERQAASDRKNMEINRTLWGEAFRFDQKEAEPMRLYFESRGIKATAAMLGEEVRFHPGVYYSHTSRHPCIITEDEDGMRWYWMDKNGFSRGIPPGKLLDSVEEVKKRLISLSDKRADIAQAYLDDCPEGLREMILGSNPKFHPGVSLIEKFGKLPAILTRIRNANGTPVNLHQTFITMDGQKAKVPQVKKVRPRIEAFPFSGGGAQLSLPGPIMSVAEGLETILSVATATGMPRWGLLNATLLANWHPPVGVKKVYIWEDPDPAGEGHAAALASKLTLMGIEAIRVSTLSVHPEGGLDWNDILMEYGVEAFPYRDWLEAA